MDKAIFAAVMAIGILVAIDHFYYFDRYTDAATLLLHDIRRSFGW